MNQLNSLIIEGNVVRQAEFLEPAAGFKVCKFPVAVNRWFKNKNGEGVTEVSYFDVETYGHMAEICSEKLTKGRGVRVVGRLKQETWKDDKEKSHSRVYVVAEHVEYKPKFPDSNETEVAGTVKTAEKSEQQTDSVKEESAVF